MSKLHKGSKNVGSIVETKEGERGPLCSNKADVRSPSLGFNPNTAFASDDIALRYLARILVQAYFEHKSDERNKISEKESSNLLPSVYKGTS